jgi:hypothetical protein
MPLMPNPYVTNVTLKNNQIVLKIEVDEFTTGETLEISGHATQTGGAFAVFNDIQPVPEQDPDGGAYIWVTAPSSQDFKKGHAVTVVLRAARVWTTVLGEPQPDPGTSTGSAAVIPPTLDEPAEEGTTWNDVRKVTYAAPSSTGLAGQTPTGSGASFPAT